MFELSKEILSKAEGYRASISKFLRDIIALPSQSSGEEAVIKRIAQEMEHVGFDKVEIDPMG
ncbi:MAG: YgeY family selenium metabolism-linked hydrolase, partial [Acetomicrobium flavidum]|nr:YgeY family selenium metabolism-linked hydrolase [Acetomicrobium flavidum]